MSDPSSVIDDLCRESAELDLLVGELEPGGWARDTPAAGWSVAHQIAHLAWTDRVALLAVTDAEAFAGEVEKALAEPATFVDVEAERGAALPPARLLAEWREGRAALERALRDAPAGTRVPWYGPPMSVASMATARLMETWAHGQDVADALGVARTPTDRLRHVARIGVRTRDFAYAIRGLTPPQEEFRVELAAPGGELWTYGPEDAAQRVTGPALDFCLLVTQRAHRADLALRARGADADRWLDIAQAFAGLPGPGRPPAEAGTPGAGTAGATGASAAAGASATTGTAGSSDASRTTDTSGASDTSVATDSSGASGATDASDASRTTGADGSAEAAR